MTVSVCVSISADRDGLAAKKCHGAGAKRIAFGSAAGASWPQPARRTLPVAGPAGEIMARLTLLKQPSAFLPLAMSLGALATVLAYLALHGPAAQADEGAAAHIWQLLMAAQLPIVLYFAARWLPAARAQAAPILALQVAAALAALAPVYLLHW